MSAREILGGFTVLRTGRLHAGGPMAENQDGDLVAALRKLRVDAGWPSTRDIKSKINYSHTYIAEVLNGRRFPPEKVLEDIVVALGGSREEFSQLRRAALAARNSLPTSWKRRMEPPAYFVGRADQLRDLDQWASDPSVRLVGVSSWGGTGKTALVTHWATRASGERSREDLRGVFGWTFDVDQFTDTWARSLLSWGRQMFPESRVKSKLSLADGILALLERVPLLLVLDGLEEVQKDYQVQGFGRFLQHSILREVLTGACRANHRSLVILTSRFPFSDLVTFSGRAAQMMEVPRLTAGEGSDLLAASSGDRLPDAERRRLR